MRKEYPLLWVKNRCKLSLLEYNCLQKESLQVFHCWNLTANIPFDISQQKSLGKNPTTGIPWQESLHMSRAQM